MKIISGYVLIGALAAFNLSSCYLGPDVEKGTNYREKGEPATMEDIVGIWGYLEDSDSQDYTIIRADGTYRFAHYEQPDDDVGNDNYADCYTFWDTSITYLENGKFLRGDDEIELYFYNGNLGMYTINFGTSPSYELKRTTITESDSTFIPVCE